MSGKGLPNMSSCHKLLVFGMEYPPSTVGTATYAHNLVIQMIARGVDVLVLAPQYSELDCPAFDKHRSYDIVRMPWTDRRCGPLRYIVARKWLRRVTDEFAPDCIWTTNGTATRVMGLMRGLKSSRASVISCLCGSDIVTRLPGRGLIRRLESIPQRRCYAHSAAINAVCDYLKSVAVEKAVDGEKIFVSPSGIDLSQFEKFRFSYERALGVNPFIKGRRVILTVARLTEQKRVDYCIRAVAQVLSRVPDLCYVVVGDGPELPRLKSMVDALGLTDRVFMKGRLNPMSQELYDLYSCAQLFLLTSVREGLANVFLEAGAFGLASIGSNDGGTPEVVVDGETGLLVDPNDVQDIAAKLQRLLLNPGLCGEMGRRARERTHLKYSMEAAGQRKFEILESVVKKAPGQHPASTGGGRGDRLGHTAETDGSWIS